jgi:hypothetical protein
MAVTEVEIPASSAPFAVAGYVTFCPTVQPGEKTRVLVLVRDAIALESNAMPRLDIMIKLSTTVWIELSATPPRPRMLIGAAYKVWSGFSQERDNLSALIDQLETANVTKGDCVLLGDLNIDVSRANDPDYGRGPLLQSWITGFKAAGFSLCHMEATWRLHVLFINPANPAAPRSHRFSTLDHVYTAGRITAEAVVVNDSTTDHRPVMARLDYAVDQKPVVVIKRRNFKKISPSAFEAALLRSVDWLATYTLPTSTRGSSTSTGDCCLRWTSSLPCSQSPLEGERTSTWRRTPLR